MKINFAFLALISAFSSNIFAEDNYFGIDLLMMDVEDNYNDSASPNAVGFKFGNKIGNNLFLEGIFAFGISEDDLSSTSGSFSDGGVSFSGTIKDTVNLKSMFGVNIVGVAPISSSSRVFGKIGFANIDMDENIELTGTGSVAGLGTAPINTSTDEGGSDTGIVLGFGANIGMGRNGSLSLEYMIWPEVETNISKLDITSINIGYKATFK